VGLQLNYDGFGIGWAHIPALAKQAEMIYDEPAPPLTRAIERPMIPESVQALLAALPAAGSASNAPAAPYIPTIAVLTYNRTPNFEESYRGFLAELAVLGYVDGKNCYLSLRDAQLDVGTLGTIIAAIDEEEPDVVVPFTTPALQAVVRRITDRPVVFCMIASGVASGAGKSNTDHLPNVTGALITFDWEYMIRVGKAAIPNLRRVGTVFAPGEVNSVFSRAEWEKALAAAGIELVSVGADRPTELPEAAEGLATQGVQAIMQISDSSSSTGFGTIVKAADRADIPVFAFAPGAMKSGATIAVSRDFEEVGRISARLMDKVLRGESPGNLPFADPQETVFLVNTERMKQFGIVLPKEMLDTARAVTEGDGAAK
jgi:ABC-type uncharacterized transport system substrate-binding protein